MNLLKTLIPEFFVRSKELSICPCCSGCLKSIGSRIRKVKDSFGDTIKLRIKRLRCRTCNKIHHELPDLIVPYKRYNSNCIESVVTDDKALTVPADESTLLRWKAWFNKSTHHFSGCLVSIAIQTGKGSVEDSYDSMSLLQRLWHHVGDAEGWLARVVRPIVNSNNWVHTRSAFVT